MMDSMHVKKRMPTGVSSEMLVRCVGRPKKELDNESRARRDVANNHERKRMQSINDGIQALRRILRHKDIDKLSKATVLLRAAEHVLRLESELTAVADENYRLKCLVKQLFHSQAFVQPMPFPPPPQQPYSPDNNYFCGKEESMVNNYTSDECDSDDNNEDFSDDMAIDLSKRALK